MTDELKDKIKKANRITWAAIEKALNGIILIWALSTTTFFMWRIVTPDVINNATAGFWGFVTLMVTSLFVIIHSRFKK